MNAQNYAFFDFDNTLAKGDSIIPFLLYCVRHHYASPSHLVRTVGAWIRHQFKHTDDFIPVKETTFSFLNGMKKGDIDRICKDFVEQDLSKRIYPEGISEIERLRSHGYVIYIVSASSELYMNHLERILPVDHILSTQCIFSEDRYTGKMGPNCKGEEKVSRIKKAFGMIPDPKNCVCYGDSPSDAAMLGLGYKQYLINPRNKVLSKKFPNAEIKKWKVKRK